MRTLSDLLCQDFYTSVIQHTARTLPHTRRIGGLNIARRGNTLDFTHATAPNQNPALLLQIFLLRGQYDARLWLSTNAIRTLYTHRLLINRRFKNAPQTKELFLNIFALPIAALSPVLRLMDRTQILGQYIPAFRRVKGMLQFDLFHQYTVDAHTLRLFEKLETLACSAQPTANAYAKINTKRPLHIAMLFHDLGKGRGGKHETRGALITQKFCRHHALDQDETTLCVWLVKHHLALSKAAQTSDSEDTDAILRFIQQTDCTLQRLDCLLILTTIDIQATSETLWTEWRARLIKDFYNRARLLLTEGVQTQTGGRHLEQKWRQLVELCPAVPKPLLRKIWQHMPGAYKTGTPIHIMPEHVKIVASSSNQGKKSAPRIVLTPYTDQPSHYRVFIYAPDQKGFFCAVSTTFASLGFDVISTNICSDRHDNVWDNFIIKRQESPERITEETITTHIQNALHNHLLPSPTLGKRSRRGRRFTSQFRFDHTEHGTWLQLTTANRTGLLAWIAWQAMTINIDILRAWCNTMNERVEDVLLLKHQGHPLDPDRQHSLTQQLNALDAIP